MRSINHFNVWVLRTFSVAVSVSMALGGCSTVPKQALQKIDIPIAVPCINERNLPVEPIYEFDNLPPYATDGEKVLALLRDWARYRKFTGELRAAVSACI